MISLLANAIWHLANLLFSLSLYLHRRFHTPFWRRVEFGIEQVEERLNEMEQLEALAEMD